jgi:hypothetical protein
VTKREQMSPAKTLKALSVDLLWSDSRCRQVKAFHADMPNKCESNIGVILTRHQMLSPCWYHACKILISFRLVPVLIHEHSKHPPANKA